MIGVGPTLPRLRAFWMNTHTTLPLNGHHDTENAGKYARVTLSHAPHVVWTVKGDETVILDEANGTYHVLNGVGSRVWELLADSATLGTLVRTIRAEYQLPPKMAADHTGSDIIERDIVALLERLVGAGAVTAAGSAKDAP